MRNCGATSGRIFHGKFRGFPRRNPATLPGTLPVNCSDAAARQFSATTRTWTGQCWGHRVGHRPDNCRTLFGPLPGHRTDMVWLRLRHFTATVRTAEGQPPVSRRLQRPYLIRGWCLTKLNGFRFLKAARDAVRMNVHKGAMTLQNLVLVHSERNSLMNDTH